MTTPTPTPTPHVELLWWSGCPSHGQAREMLAECMSELGLDPKDIDTRQVVTRAEAEREHFIGSPTIRVDGDDIVRAAQDAQPALTCRLYHRRNGRPGPLPDPEDIRDALERALARS